MREILITSNMTHASTEMLEIWLRLRQNYNKYPELNNNIVITNNSALQYFSLLANLQSNPPVCLLNCNPHF